MGINSKFDTHSNHQLIVIVITLIQMRFSVMIFIEAIMANTLLDSYTHIKTGTNAAQSCLSGSCQLGWNSSFVQKEEKWFLGILN